MARKQLGVAPQELDDTATVAWTDEVLGDKVDATPAGKMALTSIDATGEMDQFHFLGGNAVWGRPHSHALVIDSSANPTVNVEHYDALVITSLGDDITHWNLVGTPQEEYKLMIRVTDDGQSRLLPWPEDQFLFSGVARPPDTTSPGKTHRIGLIYDAVRERWVVMAADQLGY